jgi:plasmid segregation protein ParM
MQLVGLDIGYSNLKLAWGQRGEVPRLRVLPAMAAPRAQVAEALGIAGPDSPSGTGSVAGSDAAQGIEVTLDGESWIAGVRPTRVCGWQRALHADYPASQSYQALLLGALSLLRWPRIDRLVTGLPVAQALDPARREALRARLRGRHHTPFGVVEVADVRVLAQPIGTFVDVLMHADGTVVDRISEGTVLVLDVGFFSVDWALLVSGDLRRTSTGTSLEAMSVLIEQAAGRIGREHGGQSPVAAIERALAEQRSTILVRGSRVAVAPALEQAAAERVPVALEALRQDLRREHTEVDLILLTGGGARWFEPALGRLFPGVPRHRPTDPVTANASGYFHYAGR